MDASNPFPGGTPQLPGMPPQVGQPAAPAPMMRPVPAGMARPMPVTPAGPMVRPILKPVGNKDPKVRAKTAEEEEEEKDYAELAIRRAPPWLVSAVIHILVLIVLAIWMLVPSSKEVVSLDGAWAPVEGEQLEDESFTVDVEQPEEINEVSVSDAKPVSDPLSAPPTITTPTIDGSTASSSVVAPAIGSQLKGREEGMRKALMAKYGGNPQSEQAVQLALAWLAKQQDKHTGSWSLVGPYSNGAQANNTVAATAMALLAFQGNGNTHKKGKYRAEVSKGWEYLLKEQGKTGDETGNFYNGEGPHNHHLYTHGQGLIAVCELYAMTRDPKFREPAEKALAYAIYSQHRLGGWRYAPQSDSDTSVTGWLLMGLQSAKMAGFEVSPEVLERVGSYLDKVSQQEQSQYGYNMGAQPTATMTAEALLCRQYLGWRQDDPRLLRGADFLIGGNLPDWGQKNVYYWYYGTQMMHHLEGPRWDKWNSITRDMLVKNQRKSGDEAGSWDPGSDAQETDGGRLYVTCLSTFCLEVYYRHLPLYSKIRF